MGDIKSGKIRIRERESRRSIAIKIGTNEASLSCN